ncbi:MAG: C39 family peptidase [Ruthenibacterium lactatiformans]
MQTVYDREVTLHSRNAQGRNALTERAGRAAVFYKPAHARKTQPGAWRRLAAVALCCGALLCAFRLYGRARSRFGVQLPVRTVLQNPELPNGCEAASLAALLKYKGVPADKLDLAYGYIPRGDIEETTDGRTGPDPELAYAGDPAAGLICCFAQPVAQGANAYLAAQGSALRAADITGVTGQGFCSIWRGDPVIVWITKTFRTAHGSCTWLLADTGETYVPMSICTASCLRGGTGIPAPSQTRCRAGAEWTRLRFCNASGKWAAAPSWCIDQSGETRSAKEPLRKKAPLWDDGFGAGARKTLGGPLWAGKRFLHQNTCAFLCVHDRMNRLQIFGKRRRHLFMTRNSIRRTQCWHNTRFPRRPPPAASF